MTVLTRPDQAKYIQQVIDCYQTQNIDLEEVAVAKRNAEFINPGLDILHFYKSRGYTCYQDVNGCLSSTL